jgi:porin
LQQELTHPGNSNAKNGLTTFFNASFADRHTSAQDYQIAWGIKQHGLWPSWPQDEIVFAFGVTQLNPAIAKAEARASGTNM